MKRKIFIIAVLTLICTSCDWNWGWNWDFKTTNGQQIQGPSDCSYNEWSWNNGIAIVDGSYYDFRSKYFSFVTNISGEFTFCYITKTSNSFIEVTLGGQTAFEADDLASDWCTVNLGYLKSGTTVRFEGEYCAVKDLIISEK